MVMSENARERRTEKIEPPRVEKVLPAAAAHSDGIVPPRRTADTGRGDQPQQRDGLRARLIPFRDQLHHFRDQLLISIPPSTVRPIRDLISMQRVLPKGKEIIPLPVPQFPYILRILLIPLREPSNADVISQFMKRLYSK
jgi:hypothetical protein